MRFDSLKSTEVLTLRILELCSVLVVVSIVMTCMDITETGQSNELLLVLHNKQLFSLL